MKSYMMGVVCQRYPGCLAAVVDVLHSEEQGNIKALSSINSLCKCIRYVISVQPCSFTFVIRVHVTALSVCLRRRIFVVEEVKKKVKVR